jgi:hypothetical protein
MTNGTEPPPNKEFSLDFMYQVLSGRLASQLDRVDKIDTKNAAVATAVIAAIGFTFPEAHTIFDRIVLASMALPLILVTVAFAAWPWEDAPKPEAFREWYPKQPVKTVNLALDRVVYSYKINRNRLVLKARLTNISLVLIAALIVVLTVAKNYEPR